MKRFGNFLGNIEFSDVENSTLNFFFLSLSLFCSSSQKKKSQKNTERRKKERKKKREREDARRRKRDREERRTLSAEGPSPIGTQRGDEGEE